MQQNGQGGGRGHRAFGAHARLGQAQVQGMVAALRQLAINRNQVLYARDFATEHDLLRRHAQFLGQLSRVNCRGDQCLVHHLFRAPWLWPMGVFIHQASQQLLIQTAPIDANAHRFVPAQSRLDHLGELFIVFVAFAHVAWVDAVFGQRLRAIGVV